MEIGYAFSSEEHTPADLVAHARAAEEAGFPWGFISDHIHPWVDAQGHSPFVWTTVGAILQATERFRIGTGVGLAAAGNMLGGIGLVTLNRLTQGHVGHRSSRGASRRA